MHKIILPIALAIREMPKLRETCFLNGKEFSNIENWAKSAEIEINSKEIDLLDNKSFYIERNAKRGLETPKKRYSLYVIASESRLSDEFEGKIEVLEAFAKHSFHSHFLSCFKGDKHSALIAIVPPGNANRSFSNVAAEPPRTRFEYYRQIAGALKLLENAGGGVRCIDDYVSFGWAKERPNDHFLMDFKNLYKIDTRIALTKSPCKLHRTRESDPNAPFALAKSDWNALALIERIWQIESEATEIEWRANDSAKLKNTYKSLLELNELLASADVQTPSLADLRRDITEIFWAFEHSAPTEKATNTLSPADEPPISATRNVSFQVERAPQTNAKRVASLPNSNRTPRSSPKRQFGVQSRVRRPNESGETRERLQSEIEKLKAKRAKAIEYILELTQRKERYEREIARAMQKLERGEAKR